jgi:hypothetical protein
MKTAVITFSRNDGYKEKERFAIHLKTLLDTFDEVNYVDWNSEGESFLYEVLDLIPKTDRLKHFIIPPYIHDQIFDGVSNVPKVSTNLSINLALRRSDADWIAVTTTDNIPPKKEELLNFINNKANENTFYSFSRREIDFNEVLKNINNLEEYRDYLSQTTEPRYFYAKVTPNDNYSIINCCGDFQLAHKNIWFDIKGAEEQMIYNCFVDTNIQKKVVLNKYNLEAIFDVPMYHMSHKNHLPQDGKTDNLHNIASKIPPTYNDAWEWVEIFSQSQNTEEWGFSNIEIEYEII